MNATLIKAVIAFIPTSLLLMWWVRVFLKSRTLGSLLQAAGAACLLVVVLTHVSEALRLFPFMRWGEEGSAGHYLDLASAVLGVALFSLGFIWHATRRRPVR
jgi:hypothetical protein